ncbi:Respiratory supercomplex factor 1, mitochondrial [Lecanosticta acicola]|uniref:Respiratory supercomplex factor 1, mitochondrial n=1 Tax=Lecanosticta acicola TaxID=111012 RepID=A0AAI9EF51_9PEZI|nr:Respiratory supercomplex factor 1, mitochondrial [Lecanosticta acicola]
MSVPGNINTAPPPSSFDDEADFYEESRWAKLKRRLVEEPLIPLGCALTCWALYEATRSMKSGDKYRTNRMFRRRIYAQGFTILAMVMGSAYWEGDRAKRKQFNELSEEKRKKEKHESWLRELEIREEEEQELRQMRDRLIKARTAEKQDFSEKEKRAVEAKEKKDMGQPKGGFGEVKSVLEDSEKKSGSILEAARSLWQGKR